MVLFRFGFSFSWHPVVPLASLNSGNIWVVLCHPSFCRCFYDLRREALSLDLVFTAVHPLDTDGFVFRRNHLPAECFLDRSSSSTWSQVLVGGVEFFVVSRFPLPPPSPPRVVLDLGT